MTEFKGTPGPWRKVDNNMGERAVRCDGYLICSLNKPNRYIDQQKRYEDEIRVYEADQNLISAAPELLKALQILLEESTMDHDFDFFDSFSVGEKLALSAIEKALGSEGCHA